MSALIEIRQKLQDTEEAIARAERMLAKNPSSSSAVRMQSILKRKEQLVNEFSEIAKENVLDVCSYRIFSENQDNIKIISFSNALYNFQTLFTTVVDAIKNGPKERARPDAGIVQQTAFDFGYCFSGSAGIVMTMPGELLLLEESDFDKSIAIIFEMAKSDKSEQVVQYAKRLGIATIRKLYKWSSELLQAGVGADIQWGKGLEIKKKLFIQTPQLEILKNAIAATSEESETTVEISGDLVGLDVDTKKFHMKVEGGEDIKGDVAPIIGSRQTLELPKRYMAEILVKRKIYFATEKEEASYFLMKLK